MSESPRPSAHLAQALEELLRATADLIALLRERGLDGENADAGTPRALAELVRGLASDAESLLPQLRSALGDELRRWQLRAEADPAARRVAEVFEALLDVVGTQPPPRARRAVDRRAPPRKAKV